MAKARRKMRRALMKKMKKGSLTPGERRDLMELDREVNKANRQAAGAAGAGLGAALAIASKTGALDRAGDSLGAFLDSRAEVRGERRAERAEEQERKERERDEAELSKRAAAAEKSAEREQERERKEQERAARRAEPAPEPDPYLEAVRNMDRSLPVGPANEDQGVQGRRQAALAERRARKDAERENEENLRDLDPARRANRLQNEEAETSDDLVIDRDLYSRDQRRQMRRSGFNPETGEYLPTRAELERDEQDQREFDESISDAELLEAARLYNEERRPKRRAEELGSEVEKPEVSTGLWPGETYVPGMTDSVYLTEDEWLGHPEQWKWDEGSLERYFMAKNAGENQADYTGGFETTGNRREFSSEDLSRRDGPRVNNAKGGYTPFLRSMRQKLRKRFR